MSEKAVPLIIDATTSLSDKYCLSLKETLLLRTRITEMLGIEYPIIQGGMMWLADGRAGGRGFQCRRLRDHCGPELRGRRWVAARDQ